MMVKAHGVDLVELARIQAMLARHDTRFRDRCFTAGEQSYAEAGVRRRVERYASRFAAKEAVFKALGTGWTGGITWTDIEVTRAPTGCPGLVITGEAARVAASQGITNWLISLTHTETTALASVIGAGD